MANRANDNFQTYFAEKLWEMIPAFYREEDGLAENPGALRAIVEILAEQAAHVRRSNDRLWDDQFIDLCDSWAIPYLADLVGTRLVSSLNLRGRRVDVAKTIYYRRRKGTPRVLEELISDIAGWEGTVVEEFRRLARAFHGLDPQPTPLAGRFTKTPPGGLADLRRPRGAELADTPFDEYFHSADMRRQRGTDGRYNIPKIAFHLYRLPARRLTGVVPMIGPNNKTFTFDPSGRDVPLFMRRNRSENFDWDNWRSAREWQLPAPMRCRVLGHVEYVVTEELINGLGLALAAANDLRKLRNITFNSEANLREAISALPTSAALLLVFDPILKGSLIQDCGKSALLPSYVPPGSLQPKSVRVETTPGTAVESNLITSGNLRAFTTTATDKRLVIDPELGRMLFIGAAPAAANLRVDYYYGFSADIGAGGYDRSAFLETPTVPVLLNSAAIPAAAIDAGTLLVKGVTQLDDSSTYGPVANKTGIQNALVQARNFTRPYVRLASNLVLDTGANAEAFLTLEGLWLGGSGNFSLSLRGDYEQVTIRHCTLDPGGMDAQSNPIRPVTLIVEGAVEHLVIDRSITGPIRLQAPGVVEKLTVQDSIVQSVDPLVRAIDMPGVFAEMFRTTVFGELNVNRLSASETLITGLTNVTDTQNGCFRFSAALKSSRVPHPYESYFIEDTNHFFTSRRFGQPGYAQLSRTAPQGLLSGAENGSEIGAFSSLLNPIRFDGLRAKVEEFMPFGLITVFIFET
jgi:hypothetical protein